jgi:tetratricopeptide (TPR) repeat protein
MNKKRKSVLFLSVGIFGLTIIIFLFIYVINNQYRNEIPEIPDSSNLSKAVEEQISEAYKKTHRKPSAENLGELGMVYHSSANYNQAAQCYQQAIKKSKSHWKWNYYLGYLNNELGNSENVVENFNRVIQLNPDNGLAWYYLGEAYRNLGKIDLAEKAFLKITNKTNTPGINETTRIDHFPLGIYSMFQLSKIYFETGRLELAEETIKNLLGQNDLFGPAYRLLGSIFNMKGEISSGEKYTVRANDLLLYSPPVDTLVDKLALMSRSELFLLKRIDEAKNSGYSDEALRLVEQGLIYMPDNKDFVSKAISIYLLNNLNQKAAGLTDKHINYFNDNYPELTLGGILFFQKGMYEEAIKYWSAALKLNQEDVDVYKNMAMCYWKTGEKQKNQEILTEAAEINQDNPENLADIVFTFIQFKIIEKANEYLKKGKQFSPQKPKTQKLFGKIAETNGNFTAAITMYEASFKGNPRDAETINSLGNLLIFKNLWDKYIRFYEEVIKQDPNNLEYLEKLSTFYVGCPDKSLRNFDEGITYSIRAFSHKHSTPIIKLTSGKNLAVALAAKGDKQNALNTIQQTINISQAVNAPQNVKQELEKLKREIQN